MTVEVRMPQMGESIAEGTVVRWFKRPGDKVARDEPLFEISTDKVDTEVPSPEAGYVARILVAEGETVPVNTVVCHLSREAAGGAARPALERAAAPAATAPPTTVPPAAAPPPAGPRGKGAAEAPPPSGEKRLREKSSPLVRRLAAEHGIDLAALEGSGTGGRVTKDDILRRIAERGAGVGAGGGPGEAPRLPLEDRVEPLSVMRRRIAEHMVMSRRTSAHVSTVFEVDMTEVRARRDALHDEYETRHGLKLTYMPFIIGAVAEGLTRHPLLNAAIEGETVRYHGRVNLGVAVALDDGLIVPVVRDAEKKSLLELTQAVSDLAGRARSKKLVPEEVHGGTFTITNPGVFGSLIGTPIINQPQVGILCVGAVEKRPVVLPGTDAIAVRSMVFLSLTFDHRLIDGAVADRFMAGVKARLERPPAPP
jgi:2-oxoglutarate dehydrogenase E2 component (dihydrolipoamide succinyltransferase)